MANPEHLKILKQGTEAWNRWRSRHRTVRPDLSYADLREANLRSANLNHANLSYANLEGANLGRAYLEAAELRGATPRRAHLFEADLGRADLREMDLREAALWHARLAGANLGGARLTAADLRHADLTGADLRGCDLERANLTRTDLLRADLRGASLRAADLGAARLWGSRLEGADLGEVRIGRTAFNHLDLSRASGLATVHHESASSISTDTLDLTAAGLRRDPSRRAEVEIFLRYAGLRERHLDLLGAALAEPEGARAVYVHHSLADRAFARRLYAALQERGIRCWLNEHQMLPGDDPEEGLDLRIYPTDRLLLCCSEAALNSWWLSSELERAARQEHRLEEERGAKTATLVPINLDGYLASGKWKSSREPEITSSLAADFNGWEGDDGVFERELERLTEALRS